VERSGLPSGRSAAAAGAQQTDHETLLARLASLSDTAYEELLAVPAEHALERLGATSVSVSRWERDRGVLRCLVNVGELAPGDERFPADETYDLSEWDRQLVLEVVDAPIVIGGNEFLRRAWQRRDVAAAVLIRVLRIADERQVAQRANPARAAERGRCRVDGLYGRLSRNR